MNRWKNTCTPLGSAVVASLVAVSAAGREAPARPAPAVLRLSLHEARQALDEGLRSAFRNSSPDKDNDWDIEWFAQEPLQDIQVTATHFRYTDRGMHRYWSVKAYSESPELWYNSLPYVRAFQNQSCARCRWRLTPNITKKFRVGELNWMSSAVAERFADGLNRLIYEQSEERQRDKADEQEHFRAQARAWREAGGRVSLPDEARRHKVIATDAVQEKDFDGAIQHFKAALEIYPTWPEGQFNLALLYGEMRDFDGAILHMSHYLELTPEAPDAEAARDRLLIWQDKRARQLRE